MAQGSFGELKCGSDFLAPNPDVTWATGTVYVDGVGFVSVNEGSFAWTFDEPGGIFAITTDTGDDDNAALFLGPFNPTNGGCQMECRFKTNSATLGAIFAGFTTTLNAATPVMPAEYATATMTYNGTGGMAGAVWDSDATTPAWRAAIGQAAAAVTMVPAATNGGGAAYSQSLAADRWILVRAEVTEKGAARVLVGAGGRDSSMVEIARTASGVYLTANTNYFATLMFENRSAAARVFEVDYLFARGFRDWAED